MSFSRRTEFTGVWVPLEPPMKTAKIGCAAVSLGNKVFVMGGGSRSVEVLSEKEGMGDIPAFRWKTKGKMKNMRVGCAAAALGTTKIAVAGGSPTSNAEIYDTVKDTWSDLPKMRSRRLGCAAASVGGRFYVFGGTIDEDGPSAEVYNPKRRKWSSLPEMPTKRANCAAVAVDDDTVIVVGGNSTLTSGSQAYSSAVEAYNVSTKKWTILPPMKASRSGCAAVSVGSLLVVIGGEGLATCEVYNIKTKTWTTLPTSMKQVRSRPAAVVHTGNKLLVFGGESKSLEKLSSVEEFPLDALLDWSSKGHVVLPKIPKVSPSLRSCARSDALCKWADEAEEKMTRVGQTTVQAIAEIKRSRDKKIRELEEKIEKIHQECEDCVEAVEQRVQIWLSETGKQVQAARTEAAAIEQENELSQIEESLERESGNETLDMETPSDFCCKITKELMQDPVVAMDGHTYERSAIRKWFDQFPAQEQPRSPVTKELMPFRSVVPNMTMRKQCQAFVP